MKQVIIDEVIKLQKNDIDYTGLYVIIKAYQQLVFIKETGKRHNLSEFNLREKANSRLINLYMEKL